jgi:hypothetical protein
MAFRFGGSFAPPLDATKLSEYRSLITAYAPVHLQERLLGLCKMVEVFNETPASALPGKPHPAGRGMIVNLEQPEIDRIWDLVPWEDELVGLQSELDKLAPDSPVRNAAFHLLWFGKELTKDREPLTTDRL